MFFAAEDVVDDRKNTRIESGPLWAGGEVLVWMPEKPGDRKTLRIPVDSPGRTEVHITAALSPRSGSIGVWLDDLPAGQAGQPEMIDLHRPFRTVLRDFSLKPVELAKGEHKLIIEYRGGAPGVSSPEISLDFIWVKKID
jgi:hypothetical protein